jgi:hypothetical protein
MRACLEIRAHPQLRPDEASGLDLERPHVILREQRAGHGVRVCLSPSITPSLADTGRCVAAELPKPGPAAGD